MDHLDLSGLSAKHPIVLLPVRLETRFDQGASALHVRIYPDEIFADTHEPELTKAEQDAGRAYWESAWKTKDERDAWKRIVKLYPATRAAFIVDQLRPATLAVPSAEDLTFPDRPLKGESWTRPAYANLLPDRWLVVGYRGGAETTRAIGSAVRPALALTISPAPGTSRVPLGDSDLVVDADIEWTVSYAAALSAGMAVDLPLSSDDLTLGFDRLFVVGVRTGAPDTTATQLGQLLDAHHFTRGFAVVPQGSPTNNTSVAPAAFPLVDPDGAASFAFERSTDALPAGSDGLRLGAALGVPAAVVARIANARRDELGPSRAMADALFPATIDYFMRHMLLPVFHGLHLGFVRTHFVDHVRARGRYPAFRVGGVPYGVLPVTSLAMLSRPTGGFEGYFFDLMKRVRQIWLDASRRAPTVTSGDPDEALLAVLGMDASAREVRVRKAPGPAFIVNMFKDLGFLGGLILVAWRGRQEAIADRVGVNVTDPAWKNARASWLGLDERAGRFGPPLIAPGPLSETEGLPEGDNYIAAIASASIDELRAMQQGAPPATPLLARLLTHATLSEYARLAYDLLLSSPANEVNEAERYEREIVGMSETSFRTIWERFDGPIRLPSLDPRDPPILKEFLLSDAGDAATSGAVRSYQASLRLLSKVPTAELERLFTETLDVCSHRIDAWITSLAAKGLEEIRAAQEGGGLTPGSHLGAFAWVEDLRPSPPRKSRTLPGGKVVYDPVVAGGYVQAPSMTHAAAAAVLRNAYLTHSDESKARYAVNLSSSRARAGRDLLDGVRQGQSLGALLGYRFERGLHEQSLDKYIAPVRRLFPLVADKGGASGDPVEAIAARNVVDGLRLRAAFAGGKLFGAEGLPATAASVPAFTEELARLEEAFDAVADLLTAESVFQLVRGNLLAGTASMDALAQGNRSPDPDILRTSHSGLVITHRVIAVLGGGSTVKLEDEGWPDPTPRAAAEPILDAWAGALMGSPGSVRCRVSVPDPTAEDPLHRAEHVVTLASLAVRPLDMIALSTASGATGEDSELDRRVAASALAGAAPDDVRIIYAADPSWDRRTVRTFPEILELSRAIGALLTLARALRPEDLQPPEGGGGGVVDASELETRATGALAGAKKARADLGVALEAARADLATGATVPAHVATLGSALAACAFYGVPGAFPPHGAPQGNLAGIAESAAAEMDRRLAAANGAADSAKRLQALFGAGFVVLPRFTPPSPKDLGDALAKGPDLDTENKATAIRRWLQQASRVRSPLSRWRSLRLYAEALGAAPTSYDLAQLPYDEKDRWAALSKPAPSLNGKVSLVIHRHAQPATDAAWAGLLVDEWSELIPQAEQTTGVAFHFDNPGAEAAQSVLVAVPPDGGATPWSDDTLIQILNETLDLVAIRAVDGELLGDLAQILPPIFVADDASVGNTVATSFDHSLLAEQTIT